MNVSLTPELEKLVIRKVESGLYQSASEVIREGLRLLDDHDRLRGLRLSEVRKKIQAGIDELDRGEGIPGDKVLAEMKKKERGIPQSQAMSDFLIAPVARFDLNEIWNYHAIELQNPDAADHIRDELFDAFYKLAQTPGLGHFRSDLAEEPLRFWRVRSYLIIYRSEKRPIEVVRVLHGARDVQTILGGATPP